MKKLRRFSVLPLLLSLALAFASLFLDIWETPQSTSAEVARTSTTPAAAIPAVPDTSSRTPSVVTVSSQDNRYLYMVNGASDVIHGVGYNPIYRNLSNDERAQRYDRDFSLMRQAGINMISGWDEDKGYMQDKFDELLLDKAQQWGIGVIMPFYLPPDGDYSNPEFIQQTLDDLSNKVTRFKDYPAIRMWGVGNEVLAVMGNSPQAEPFADFLVQAVDTVHSIDPNHPVIYREEEDVWAPFLRDAFAKDGVDRPWFIYGMNVYTYRIFDILNNWPSLDWNVPVVVSEFAPVGLHGDARARGYVSMWRDLRSFPSFVFGGLAYCWTTAGPEPVDRDFGLVYPNDVATDNSFNALTGEYRNDSVDRPKASTGLTSRPDGQMDVTSIQASELDGRPNQSAEEHAQESGN